MTTKITYTGGIPEGEVVWNHRPFAFKRGKEIEVPFELAVSLEYQGASDWKTTDAVRKHVEDQRKAEAAAAEAAKKAAQVSPNTTPDKG